MDRTRVFSSQTVRLTGLVMALGFLSACEESQQLAFLQPADSAQGTTNTRSAPASKTVERDVEAPEVFQVSEAGLWDGRPSLGGVWVAHPDVTEPERVIIRNEANDQFVIGALFRREREIPGPRLQTSSDAAAALGMLAGAPVRLNVTALRRETEATPEPAQEQTVTASLPDGDPISESAIDPIAGAAAAIDAAETTSASATAGADQPAVVSDLPNETPKKGPFAGFFKPKAQKTASAEPATAGVAAASEGTDSDGPIVASDVPNAEPKKGPFANLFKPKAADPEPVELAATNVTDLQATTDDAGPKVVSDVPNEKPKQGFLGGLFKPKPKPPAPEPVELASAGSLNSALTQPVVTPLPPSAPKPAAAAPATPNRAKLSLDKPYIQIGIFSVEDNAERTAKQMRSAGMVPTIRQQELNGKPFWRVLVGPARSSNERSALLKQIKTEGFSDAYAVSN